MEVNPLYTPAYAGEYEVLQEGFSNTKENPALQPTYDPLNPFPGSVDLLEARDSRGTVAPNWAYLATGPNTGAPAEFSNTRINIPADNAHLIGPNTGGVDSNTQTFLAYQASLVQQLTQEASAAALAQGL